MPMTSSGYANISRQGFELARTHDRYRSWVNSRWRHEPNSKICSGLMEIRIGLALKGCGDVIGASSVFSSSLQDSWTTGRGKRRGDRLAVGSHQPSTGHKVGFIANVSTPISVAAQRCIRHLVGVGGGSLLPVTWRQVGTRPRRHTALS